MATPYNIVAELKIIGTLFIIVSSSYLILQLASYKNIARKAFYPMYWNP
jgi:hypothetical protein